MTKVELIAAVAEKANLTKKDAEAAVNGALDVITESLKGGDKVTLVGFGTFEVRERPERKGRNPQTGEWEDYPNYVDCTMFGTRAEAVGRYISKGSKVAIEGKLRYSSWERDGQRRSKLEVIVDDIEFMNARPASSPSASPAAGGGEPQYTVPEAPALEIADEDIPF